MAGAAACLMSGKPDPLAQVLSRGAEVATVIVPFAAGTPVDSWTRAVVAQWTRHSVVDNRPGALGWIGARAAARAASDGFTLVVLNGATQSSVFFRAPPFDILDALRPVCGFYRGRHVLFAAPAFKGGLAEALALARKRPGALRYGYASANTRLVMERFKRAAGGVQIDDIPYKSVAQMALSLMNGEIDFVVDAVGTYQSLLLQGRVRALATVASVRDPALPDVPTMQEQGIATTSPGYSGGFWVPASTSSLIVGSLTAQLRDAVQRPQVRQTLSAAGAEAIWTGPEAFLAAVHAERQYWAQAAAASGYLPE